MMKETEAYLKALIGEETKLAPEWIGSSDRLEAFGIDSVMINRLNTSLERDLGALPKILFYEHETVGGSREFPLAGLRVSHPAGNPNRKRGQRDNAKHRV